MRKIILGKTGAEVSAISLGTWSYGGANKQGEIPVGWEGQQDNDSINALLRCHEIGINHWDTADVYGDGRSEQLIGSIWDKISRDEVFIATKVGWDRGPYDYWYNPDHMRTNMERSLKNLRTDCVDLIYLHHCNFGKQEQYFDDALDLALANSRRNPTPLTLVMVDIDRFKALNDEYGHQTGDECLRQISKLMREQFQRQTDIVARYGGEEFIAILYGQTLSEATLRTEQLREAIETNKVKLDDKEISVTASFGLAALIPPEVCQNKELVGLVDTLLYQSKKEGKNRLSAAHYNQDMT